ncbi:MAG TPA: BON domain-containing protein [Candidatus Angelobacter sp.]|nr:BON domain-containing protein [Candidatus Angelobacter sp.]
MMRRNLWVTLFSLALFALGCQGGRSDSQIASDVQNKIQTDGTVPEKQLTISSNDGVVTLSGNVSSQAAREAAGSDAGQIKGVKTVVNNLEVAPAAAQNMQAVAPPPAQEQANAQPPAESKPAPGRAARPRREPAPRDNRDNNSGNSGDNNSAVNNGNNAPRSSAPGDNSGANNAAAAEPPKPVTPPAPQPILVPTGTQLSIRLNDEVNSEKAQVGDIFHASISTPVQVDGNTVIPTTADIEGRVVDVKSAGRFAGQSVLTLQLTRLLMSGKSYTLTTDQWTKSGSGRGKATAAKVGGGAAVGAILGGIFGGGKGAAIGAAAGAGAGTGVSAATKGQQIILKPETVLNFQLQNSLTVTPGGARQPMN